MLDQFGGSKPVQVASRCIESVLNSREMNQRVAMTNFRSPVQSFMKAVLPSPRLVDYVFFVPFLCKHPRYGVLFHIGDWVR